MGKVKAIYHGVNTDPEDIINNLLHPPTSMIAVDTETISINDKTCIGIGIAINPHEAYYVPIWPEPSEILFQVYELLTRKDITKVGHNYNFDIESLRLFGDSNNLPDIDVWSIHDTNLMAQVMALPPDLHTLGSGILHNYSLFTIAEVLEQARISTGKSKVTMLDADQEQVALKCCNDVRTTYGLYEKLIPMMSYQQWDCYEVDRHLTGILKTIERKGLALNESEVLSKYQNLMVTCELYEDWADEQGFSISSPQQVGMFLASNRVVLPFTKSGRQYDTSEEVLEKISHPLAQQVLAYRKARKLMGTYIEPYLGISRGYTHFRLDLSTGRLASYDRNWQNIPPDYRSIFSPDSGIFTWGDMSQLEMRVFAYLSQDKRLLEAYRNDESIHEITFKSIYPQLPYDKSIPEYVKAKTFNFAMVFDAMDSTLAIQCGITPKLAGQWKQQWFDTYPQAKDFMREKQSTNSEYEETVFGRRMRIPLDRGRGHANKCRINFPTQGSGADINKRSIVKLWDSGFLTEGNFRVQVHDEIVLDGDYYDSWPHAELMNIHPEIAIPWEVNRSPVWV